MQPKHIIKLFHISHFTFVFFIFCLIVVFVEVGPFILHLVFDSTFFLLLIWDWFPCRVGIGIRKQNSSFFNCSLGMTLCDYVIMCFCLLFQVSSAGNCWQVQLHCYFLLFPTISWYFLLFHNSSCYFLLPAISCYFLVFQLIPAISNYLLLFPLISKKFMLFPTIPYYFLRFLLFPITYDFRVILAGPYCLLLFSLV